MFWLANAIIGEKKNGITAKIWKWENSHKNLHFRFLMEKNSDLTFWVWAH